MKFQILLLYMIAQTWALNDDEQLTYIPDALSPRK
jgi:hypothetical protein